MRVEGEEVGNKFHSVGNMMEIALHGIAVKQQSYIQEYRKYTQLGNLETNPNLQ